MSTFTKFLFVSTLVALPLLAQERKAVKKPATFPEAVEQAKKAVEEDKLGAAVAALQAAIRDLQKKQRAQILTALPKPEGFEFRDEEVDDKGQDAFNLAAMGLTISRRYENGDKSLSVEVTANSPLIQMLGMMFNNPALVEAQGGEMVKYGVHKAILTKSGDDGQELQILMHDAHLIKINSQGVGADDLLKIFDQAFVDRLEKPLGKNG
ncbi:MAG: hypothetical protein MUC36_14220 [Planctomycetes bacterium]|jgi:hypothetical protein|nr:hypothetical protein [Planctomycetota bacterium]